MNLKPPEGETIVVLVAGFVVAAPTDVASAAVSVILGLISIQFLKSRRLPLDGETNKGISCVVIAVVLDVNTSSIG